MLKKQLSDKEILDELRFDRGEWLPFKIGDYPIIDSNRLLQYFTEHIFLSQYNTPGSSLETRMTQYYNKMNPTDYIRMLFRTGKL